MARDSGTWVTAAARSRRAQVGLVVLLAVLAIGLTWAALDRERVFRTSPSSVAGTSPQSAVEGANPTVAFLGDGSTAGTGASGPSTRWTTRLALEQGWSEANHGRPGTGYATSGGSPDQAAYGDRLATLIAGRPDAVVVSGGRSDDTSSDAYASAVAQVFQQLREGLPDARLLAVSPIWDDGPPPEELAVLGDTVRESVEAAGGSYLDIGQPLEGRPGAIAEDGVHPNDAGHEAISSAVSSALGNTAPVTEVR